MSARHRFRLVPFSVRRQYASGIVLVTILLLAGCTKTLIFLEHTSTKFGIAVNDDPTTPVEVTVGIKRKVLSVSPPREPLRNDESGNPQPAGEAVSLVSRFDLAYAEGTGLFGGKLTITNAFASGEAARTVAGSAPAMSGLLGVKLLQPLSIESFEEEATRLRRAMLARVDELDPADAIALASNPPTMNPSMQTLAESIDRLNQRQSNEEAAKAVLKAWLSQGSVPVGEYPKWAAALGIPS